MSDREGYASRAIIIFVKRAHMCHSVRLSDDEAKLKGYQIESIITQYRYWLRIDIWFVILEFEWKDKLKKI